MPGKQVFPWNVSADEWKKFAEDQNRVVTGKLQGEEKESIADRKIFAVGRKVMDGARSGGREKNPTRDLAMAQEFQRRRANSKLSGTALKRAIGKEHGLERSAAIEAINRGLKEIVR